MLNRNVSLGVCLLTASLAAFGDASSGTQYVVEFPPSNSSGTRFQGFIANANSQNPVFDANGPTNVSQIVFKPDGTKAYILGTSGVQSVDPAFSSTSFHPINGISGTPTTMAISPDGKYLYLGAGGLFILDTSNNAVLSSSNIPITGSVIGIAFSVDSQYAYVLTDSATGSALTVVKTSNQTRVGTALPFQYSGATSVTISPKNQIYVTETNRLYAIDPATLLNGQANCVASIGQLVGCVEIDLNATPGPLRFAQDGSAAYFINSTANISGGSLFKLDVASNTVTTAAVSPTATNQHPVFTDVYVGSPTRIFALTLGDTTLWDVTPSPFGVAPSTSLATFPGGINSVLSAAVTKEQPAATYLFLLVANGQQTNLVRIVLANNSVDLTIPAFLGNGVLQTALVPPQSGAASFTTFNANQTVKAGGVSLPLGAIVLNGNGLPIYNLPVTYTETDTAGGLTIASPNGVTNANGYVETTVTAPSNPGTYVVTLTAGAATTTYALTVSGSGGPGGGPGPTSQVTILSGNGLLMHPGSERSQIYNPLTVLVTDTNGKPLSGESVTFSVVSGPVGSLSDPVTQEFGLNNTLTVTTDENGIAAAGFAPALPPQGQQFAIADVNASTSVGSVDFSEVSFITAADQSLGQFPGGGPAALLTKPNSGNVVISAGEGDTVADAIEATIHTGLSPALPINGVGIRIGDGTDFTMPGVASCPATSLSDSTGVVRCDLKISCNVVPGQSYGFAIDIGGVGDHIYYGTLNITAGSGRTIVSSSGDKQNGQIGQKLPQPLVATVTDNCGAPVAGAQVTWSIQGSGTLTGAQGTSNANGQVSTGVVFGQIPGTVKVTASLGNNGPSVSFTATSSVVVGSVSLVSGSGQTAVANQAFAQPVIFVVKDTNGNPVQGITVTFSITSGSASLGASSATSNASGQVSVNVTAGAAAGPVTIQAAYTTLTASANLTVQPQGPVVMAANFYNAAYDPTNIPPGGTPKTGLVPCGINSVIGKGLVPGLTGQVFGSSLGIGILPYSLLNFSMTINGVPVPLYSAANLSGGSQVVYFQTPCEVQPGQATVVLSVTNSDSSTGAATTTVTGVQVSAAQPAIFTYAGPNGKRYADIYRASDGSPVTPSNLAHRGETYFLVAANLGQTTPPIITNGAATGNQTLPVSQVIAGINNAGVPVTQVVYAGVGVYYVFFQIPANAGTGTDQPVALNLNGAFDLQGTLIAGVQ